MLLRRTKAADGRSVHGTGQGQGQIMAARGFRRGVQADSAEGKHGLLPLLTVKVEGGDGSSCHMGTP